MLGLRSLASSIRDGDEGAPVLANGRILAGAAACASVEVASLARSRVVDSPRREHSKNGRIRIYENANILI